MGAHFFKLIRKMVILGKLKEHMAQTDNIAKLKRWINQLQKLEKELEAIMQRRGEAAQMGDLSENAAFQMASEDADTYRVRIDEVKKIISNLEKGSKKSSKR